MAARASAHDIYQNVKSVAADELERSTLGLAFSGFSAGLNISFSLVAGALLFGLAVDPDRAHLWSAVGYPVGFILIVFARSQLFTENTLTPVILVLATPSRRNIANTLRLWSVVLAANLGGAFVFSYAASALDISPAVGADTLAHVAAEAYRGTWGSLFIRAVFGGWLIALMTWMIHAGGSLMGQILLVWIIVFIIKAAGFSHSVAGAAEVLYLAHERIISYVDWWWHFQIPVTLGNAIGGVVFVALVNYAQVVGAGQDVERAEARAHIERLRGAGRRTE